MSATFRFIYYTDNPFTGARYPIASLVRRPDGTVEVAPADTLPSVECLGSRAAALGLRRLADHLDGIESFDRLPPVFGPYTILGEEHVVPAGVDDAVSWVQRLLSRPTLATSASNHLRRPQRASLGYRFFETWHVARHVQKTFHPGHDWDGRLGRVTGLPTITHWVASRDSLLLMEPVVADRRQFESDINEIATRFLAYRYALGAASDARASHLYAYLPAGGSPARRAEAKATLADAAHTVFDTEVPDEREALLSRIRAVAAKADGQATLRFETH